MKNFYVMFKYLILLIATLIISNVNAQKPYWLEEGGLPQSDYFDYYIGIGEDVSLYETKKKAVQDVLQKISNKKGMNYTISGQSELKGNESEHNGNFTTDISFSFNTKVQNN